MGWLRNASAALRRVRVEASSCSFKYKSTGLAILVFPFRVKYFLDSVEVNDPVATHYGECV